MYTFNKNKFLFNFSFSPLVKVDFLKILVCKILMDLAFHSNFLKPLIISCLPGFSSPLIGFQEGRELKIRQKLKNSEISD